VALPDDGGLVIRVARAADEEALTRVDAAAWTPASGFPSVIERVNDPFFTFFTDNSPPAAHLVAEAGGLLLGYIRVQPVTRLRENEHVLGIMGLAVDPAARGRGVAAALLAAAERYARARGGRKLSLRVLSTNEPALRLYERSGYRREGTLRGEFRIRGEYVDDILMAKHLD
jgi:ribosomal protein S18 acetylase RimI-like enzyme